MNVRKLTWAKLRPKQTLYRPTPERAEPYDRITLLSIDWRKQTAVVSVNGRDLLEYTRKQIEELYLRKPRAVVEHC